MKKTDDDDDGLIGWILSEKLLEITDHAEISYDDKVGYNVIYDLPDGRRRIQIRILNKRTGTFSRDSYGIKNIYSCDKKMIIIAISLKDDIAFICILNQDLTVKGNSLTVTNNSGSKLHKYFSKIDSITERLKNIIKIPPTV